MTHRGGRVRREANGNMNNTITDVRLPSIGSLRKASTDYLELPRTATLDLSCGLQNFETEFTITLNYYVCGYLS